MWRVIFKMMVLASLVLPVVCLADVDSLPQAVANAQHLLTTKTLDRSAGTVATEDLLRLAARYPDSPLVPEALLVAAQIDIVSDHGDAALALARRVVIEYPLSTSAPAAFDLAWDRLTIGGKNPLDGVELAVYFASALGTSPAASRYYALAFEAYRAAQQWQNALNVGAQFAAQCTAGPSDAPLLLALSEIALAANDTPLAQKTLENFLSRFENLPQAIPARVQLAQRLCRDKQQGGRPRTITRWPGPPFKSTAALPNTRTVTLSTPPRAPCGNCRPRPNGNSNALPPSANLPTKD